jgi:hypothetical protein
MDLAQVCLFSRRSPAGSRGLRGPFPVEATPVLTVWGEHDKRISRREEVQAFQVRANAFSDCVSYACGTENECALLGIRFRPDIGAYTTHIAERCLATVE